MVRRARGVRARHMTWVVLASALAMVSCSPEAEPVSRLNDSDKWVI